MKKRCILFFTLFITTLLCIAFTTNVFAANTQNAQATADRFLTDKHLGIGCNVSYKDNKMLLDIGSITAHVETVGLNVEKLEGANSLKVVFDCDNKCSGVRLFVLTNDGEYIEESYSSIKNTKESPSVCYLPIKSKSISDIRLVFEDLETDIIEIHSITPYSISLKDNSYIGEIDTCAINVSSNEVLVIGKIKSSEIDKYSGKELLLFEQPLNEITTVDALSELKSTLKTTVGSNEFIFRIKCNKKEELRSYLYKKYTVAIKNDDSYIIIDSPKCISNPDSLSKQTNSFSQTSGKGQFGSSLSFMQKNMITDTLVTVDIGKFFSHSSSSGAKYECGGNVFYYNPEYVEQTDALLLPYAEKGIRVTLLITLSDTQNEALNKILIHPDSSLESSSPAFNTNSKTSLSYLRAFCEFFAQRYCVESPCVSKAVFGKEVANAKRSYNMGEKSLYDFTDSYSIALLTVNNAFRSVSKSVGIYTHIDNNWDTDIPFGSYDRYDNKAFLTSLNNRISDYGNIDWGVVINVYPKEQANYLAYADPSISTATDSDYITFGNLEILSDFLKNTDMLYNNAQRSLVIVEEAQFEGLDEQTIAASYVYNYYKSQGLSAEAYITNVNFEFGNVMKYIDTSLTDKTTKFALDILKIKSWNEAISSYNANAAIYKSYSHSEFSKLPENVKGRIEVSSFSGDTENWGRYGMTEEFSAGKEMSDRSELLSVKLGKILQGESKGIYASFEAPLDLSLIPLLHFDVNIASLPPNVDSAILTVKFTSGNETIEFSGSIDKTVWTEVYCDLSSFQGISNVGSISITLSSENGEVFDDPQLFISSIEGISLEYDSEYLNNHFSTDKKNTLLEKIVQEYAIPFLMVVICVSALILSYRHNKKE